MNRPSVVAEEIFLALADLSPDEREAAIRERCGGDAALRSEVEGLLAAIHAPEDGFLDPTTIPTLDMNADRVLTDPENISCLREGPPVGVNQQCPLALHLPDAERQHRRLAGAEDA